MRIALFCSSRNKIALEKTGGVEQPTFYLTRGLAKKGHKVTLYAAKGSKVPGVQVKEISPFVTCIKQEHLNIQERISSFYDNIALANFFSREAKNFDLVQFNSCMFYEILPFTKFSNIPVIIQINYTHHLLYPYIKSYLKRFPNVYYLPFSNFIKTVMPDLNYLNPIYPAVDLDDFKFCQKSDDYLLFIGRICPNKGAHLAIKVAQKAKKKLIIAGRIDEQPPHEYFKNFIEQRIDNKHIIYVGEVDYETKIKLYQKALATLFPIQWNEAFGHVQVESMACGTPVVAFGRASVPEVILDKESGFIVKDGDINQMVKVVKSIQKLDRQKVRRWVEEKFSIKKNVDEHEKVYKQLIK